MRVATSTSNKWTYLQTNNPTSSQSVTQTGHSDRSLTHSDRHFLDNAPVHRSDEMQDLIAGTGALPRCLPPGSPDTCVPCLWCTAHHAVRCRALWW